MYIIFVSDVIPGRLPIYYIMMFEKLINCHRTFFKASPKCDSEIKFNYSRRKKYLIRSIQLFHPKKIIGLLLKNLVFNMILRRVSNAIVDLYQNYCLVNI